MGQRQWPGGYDRPTTLFLFGVPVGRPTCWCREVVMAEPVRNFAACYQPKLALTTVIAGSAQFWLDENQAIDLARQLMVAVQIRRQQHPAQTGEDVSSGLARPQADAADPNPAAGQVP
jgi:hypothetical protein